MVKFDKKPESGLWVALIGDLAGSRRHEDRSSLQNRLRALLKTLNAELPADSLAAPLAFTAGDEFQALLRQPSAAVEIILRIAERLRPERVLYGLGRGTLSTELRPEVGALDGPCFHAAREALTQAKGSDRWILTRGFGEGVDLQIGAFFLLMDAIRGEWTEKQARHVQLARTMQQKEVAALLEVSPSVISESLKAAHFESIREGEVAVRSLLAAFDPVGRAFTKSAESILNSPEMPNSAFLPKLASAAATGAAQDSARKTIRRSPSAPAPPKPASKKRPRR